ncbi:hypothetical protein [Verrucomicrobium spinosum]|uniref:hypothetical protein n=1 Tax=Verrucomicrobium spinosum TaxID=2736 RepID=UPI000ABF3525|nr:hypothetical protein [Verrucomicrobium spinosum]
MVEASAEWGTVDKVVGIDARGFIFGAMLAARLGCGFIPARKRGKLPWKTRGVDYALEYGTASLEMHEDASCPASGWCWQMICWPPAAPRARRWNWCRPWGPPCWLSVFH